MRLLFVDDEESIRATMPAILRREGFDVTVAGTVGEGLELIQNETFDVLLTDLNIGNPGDGFVLVSAMRRLQPEGQTFILTGFPDFETALQAIRSQVDDYFVKPADIPTLVRRIKERLITPRHLIEERPKRVSRILSENQDRIVELWLARVLSDKRLAAAPLSREDRVANLREVLQVLAMRIDNEGYVITESDAKVAAVHGELRARQGYSLGLILKEARILATVVGEVVQENLLVVDLSMLVPDVLRIGVCLSVLLEESLAAFERARASHVA